MGDNFRDVGRAFGQCRTADGPDYWDDPEGRHADHRRHVRNLLIACAFFILAGIAIHPSLLVLLFVLGPFLLLEMHMLRRSGNRSLPLIRAAVQPYEPGSGAVDVIIELEPNPNGDRRPN